MAKEKNATPDLRNKRIWFRVGMSVPVTESEYEEMRRLSEDLSGVDRYYDLNDNEFPDWFIERIKTDGKMDGDSYIPESFWFWEHVK